MQVMTRFSASSNGDLPEKFQFEIRTLGWLAQFGSLDNFQPRRKENFEIIYILTGGGTIWIDMRRCVMEPGMVFCIRPGTIRQMQLDDLSEGYVMTFNESFLNVAEHEFDLSDPAGLFEAFATADGIDVMPIKQDMQEFAIKMKTEFEQLYPFRLQVLRRYLRLFLIFLTRQMQLPGQPVRGGRTTELVRRFMTLLEKHFKEEKMVAQYAHRLCVTPNYLNEIVKRYTGYSAGHLIRQRVVLEAKRLGRYTGSCMKEVAYTLGFSDSAHFSKFFKVVTGVNFSEFKRALPEIAESMRART
jgi:AraC family transcriptional regulator, transcriptional activator of pobA